MASKKLVLTLGLIGFLALGSYAQIGGSYDVMDTSVIPEKRMEQHNEFLNNEYNFPAKPRNQWEVGVKGGMFNILGDVKSKTPTPGFGVHVRKAFGYVFSLRGSYQWGLSKGQDFQASNNYEKNSAWAPNYSGNLVDAAGNRSGGGDPIFYNYRTIVQDLSLQGVFTLNNVRFHKNKTNYNIYGFAGVGLMVYQANINALNSNNAKYDFLNNVNQSGTYGDRKQIKDQLKNLLDDTYETPGESEGSRTARLFNKTLNPSATVGLGVAYRLGKRVNLAIENRHTFVKDDLLDGQRWQEQAHGDAALTREYDSYNFASIGLNFNLGSKSVEPLWWLNPLDYAYNELNAPRHMKLPKVVLPDGDGDGVTDQFDEEPNTPAGCPVDTKGRSRDTDGDGVPDCRDKELITPTHCQPVNADGVGKCPDPECCKNIPPPVVGCQIGNLPSISFDGKSATLNNTAKALLASVASRLRGNPECRLVIEGHGDASKAGQQLSWDRVNAIVNYLVEMEGVSSARLFPKFGMPGDVNTVDIRQAYGDEGPNTVPAPHPHLRKKN